MNGLFSAFAPGELAAIWILVAVMALAAIVINIREARHHGKNEE